jgi:molybdenum cofactor biosynthesis enzyme MoaA
MSRELKKTDNFAHVDPEKRLQQVFCRIPYNEFHVYDGGYVSNCCFNWLPTELGSIHDQTLLEISENVISQQIQRSVREGEYNFCTSSYCPHLNRLLSTGEFSWPLEKNSSFERIYAQELRRKIKLYLSFDYSCNLSCESCRSQKIFFDRKTASPLLLKTYDRISSQIAELLANGYQVEVNITGSGDAFASPLFYDLMCGFPVTDKLEIHISTNGTMMTEKKLNMPTKDQVKTIFVSVDSCIPDSYAKIRRGGVFKHVEANLDALDQMALRGEFPSLKNWQLNVIVQYDNYKELGDFVDWSRRFKTLNSIFFTKILDWEHLPPQAFDHKAVWKPTHPEHAAFLAQMQDPRLRDRRVILGNLTEYLRN